MNKTKFNQNIKKIKKWAEGNNIKLVATTKEGNGSWCPKTKIISYNSRLSLENRLFVILHECGHFLVERGLNSENTRYSIQNKAMVDKRHKFSQAYRIEILREEFDAWERGERLAKRLKLDVDLENYKKFSTKCVVTYCDWIARRDWGES